VCANVAMWAKFCVDVVNHISSCGHHVTDMLNGLEIRHRPGFHNLPHPTTKVFSFAV